ncbi:MAG: copper amine oxidase N-terminal domain-containing protein [Clostridiales bacterium]|nr:copper amine oxidase N-terminal domain-containing protein [Clostridiales bacterium]
MRLKQKLTLGISAVLIAAMVPVNAMAAVKVKIYGDRRVYGTETPFNTYIELESTGYGLIKNTATIKLTLNNGEFAVDKDGNYLPVYVTDSKKELDREEIAEGLADGSIDGFGIIPDDEDTVKLTIPEDMIDDYCQIMFTAHANDYGDVTVSLKDNRDIKYIVKTDDDDEDEDDEETIEEAEPEVDKVIIPIGSKTIYIGGEELELDMPAYISNDVTKLPLRAISEIFGADVYWNGAEKTVTIELGDDTLFLRIGDKRMMVNGYAVPLSAAPEISNGRTFVPLRDIAKMFGIDDIEWDEETQTVSFDYTEYTGFTYLTYNS